MPLNVYKMCLTFSQRLNHISKGCNRKRHTPWKFSGGGKGSQEKSYGGEARQFWMEKSCPPPVTLTWHNCAIIKSQNLPKFYIFNWFQPSILVDALPEGGGMLIFFWGRRGKNMIYLISAPIQESKDYSSILYTMHRYLNIKEIMSSKKTIL